MIEVMIGGCESSYFAGEQIELTVTFTNTNARPSSSNSSTPASPNPPRSAASHRRGTHSTSSAPLPRPPTSPGVHQVFHTHHRPSLSVSANPPRTRRGFIGLQPVPLHSHRPAQPDTPFNAAASRSQRLASSRSLSVSLSPPQREDPSSDSLVPSPSTPDAFPPRSSSVLQTPARQRVISSEMALPVGHPHARKQSLQFNVSQTPLDTSESLSLAPVTGIHSSPVPLTPLAPSPLSQSMVYGRSTSPPLSPFQTSGQQPQPPSVPPPKLGLGIELSSPPRPSVSRKPSGEPRTPSKFNPPGYETLLWAYVQLSGTVELDPAFSRPEAVRQLAAKLAKRPVGGGSLDLKEPSSYSTASSPLSGLGALLGLRSPPIESPSRGTPSRSGFLSTMFSPRPTPVRSDGTSSSAATSGSLTTFEPPQSLLAVDLALAPGESKSFRYRVNLPFELPPTFRGRALRFSYQFIVGTCRGGPHMENQSRLLKVPLRVYNHIPVGRPLPLYDLLWPSRARASLLNSAEVEGIGAPPSTNSVRLNGRRSIGGPRDSETNAEVTALQQFGRSLLDTEQEYQSVEEEPSEGAFNGCRTAIEIMTRQSSKASYDVNKGGCPVAILILPKTIFRLGESVHGTIEINCFEDVPVSVLKVSVLLEAHESLPARFRTTGKGTGLRRVHGEHHDSQTAHTGRTTFALDIPSDGVPAFRVANEAGDGEQLGGLEWRLRICFLVSEEGLPMAKESGAGEWGETWAASDVFSSNEGAVETVECEVGIVVLPSHTLFASVPLKFGV